LAGYCSNWTRGVTDTLNEVGTDQTRIRQVMHDFALKRGVTIPENLFEGEFDGVEFGDCFDWARERQEIRRVTARKCGRDPRSEDDLR
jgi:hypothetical protein